MSIHFNPFAPSILSFSSHAAKMLCPSLLAFAAFVSPPLHAPHGYIATCSIRAERAGDATIVSHENV